MKTTLLILKLIRWPNLLMMAIILVLMRYCILYPVYLNNEVSLQMPAVDFFFLLLSTILIGGGGYIVNDILDVDMDEVNRPGHNIIGKDISKDLAWKVYYIINLVGIGLGTYLSFRAGKLELGIFFLVIATALYYYSLKYKYLFLWGNLTISVLGALTVLIVWLFEFFYLKQNAESFITISPDFPFLNKWVLGYAFLAFYYTLLREIIKDTQDMEGDKRFGCQTLPIKLGETKTRLLIIILSIVSSIMLVVIGYYIFPRYLLVSSLFIIVALVSGYLIFRLSSPNRNHNYKQYSLITKIMMAIGILSMVFLWFPN